MNKQLNRAEIEIAVSSIPAIAPAEVSGTIWRAGQGFRTAKRLFDVVVATAVLPLVAIASLILIVLNPIWNPGPLFFIQTRMGRDCRPFTAIKFRSMRPTSRILRGPNDPVEEDRITPLGHWLRRIRVDELPQFLNVLAGEMSVVGPRPDYWVHAAHYLNTIPGYRQRHLVRPGITGLAQVDGGYAEGINATVDKTRHDLRYIRTANIRTELYVIWRTIVVMVTGSGAR